MAARRIAVFGADAPITDGVIHSRHGRALKEVLDVEPSTMTWTALETTLIGIWLFTTLYGYASRSFTIANEEGWIGLGQFSFIGALSPPTSLPAGFIEVSWTVRHHSRGLLAWL